ncbi:type 1 glutamine amidotransferase domain-containing protein [Piscinibacter terrae]|uniref:Type 1 glutamine amidotransferase domain-containing protein n=1 Tax=Piscinibacter terrae TaxID=2496871 RepID=A0A3N7HY66_9BURK|nr:type 1 glutamine amidotransferase domain-containing protein [Albitalea terrae]RQP26011.1 type 1 glutamine amidotransferase domain-containing protein [Albitalea terrae]
MRALFITTSSDELASGHPTGLWVEEFAVPYMAARKAGIDVVVASPKGGAVPLDAKSAPSDRETERWAPALAALRKSVPLESVRDESFEAIFIPGGHGPMVDLAHDQVLHDLVSRHDAEGKLIAAVCHGPAALVYAQRANGAPFFAGRRATGFTNTEERMAGLHDEVPFLLEDVMKAKGADFHSALLPMLSHVEHDGNLLTGQNPRSSDAIATAMVDALTKRTAPV